MVQAKPDNDPICIQVFDGTQTGWGNLYLSNFWEIGGATLGRRVFDHRLKVLRPPELYQKLGDLRDRYPHRQFRLQYWGHGAPAELLLGPYVLDVPFMLRAAGMTESDEFWARGCNTIQGEQGQAFAIEIAKICPFVGHTRVVAGRENGGWSLGTVLWQSGCYGLRAGESPHWSALDRGGSGRRQPNTVSTFAMRTPAWCYQPVRVVH